MLTRRTTLPLGLMVGALVALPAGQAMADPVAQSAGGDVVAQDPTLTGVPIMRTEKSLNAAGDSIDKGDGATAGKQLTSVRKYLIRSYNGAKYLISLPPPPPADDRASAATTAMGFKRLAKQLVKARRKGDRARTRLILAQASDDGPVGPVIADNPTAVFNVLMSEYSAATAGAGMYPDTTGSLQSKDALVFNTAIILRNRIVKLAKAAEPPAPAEDRATAAQEEGTPTYGAVMPGLIVLLDDEIQMLQQTVNDVPAASQPALQKAIAADQKIKDLVNATWPPAVGD
jgi:hypothetical protein